MFYGKLIENYSKRLIELYTIKCYVSIITSRKLKDFSETLSEISLVQKSKIIYKIGSKIHE